MDKSINKTPLVAIIGCGNIGSKLDENQEREYSLSHASAFIKAGIPIHAFVEPNQMRLDEAGKNRSVPNLYLSLDQLLENGTPDIASVCASTSTRVTILKALFEKNTPLVILEKPIALSLSEAKEIRLQLEKSQSKCIVNYSRRWDNDVIELQSKIDNNELGKIQSVTVRYGKGLTNNASHALNLIDFFFPDRMKQVVHVSNPLKEKNVDPSLQAVIHYMDTNNTFSVNLIPTDHTKFTLWETDFIFDCGRITFSNSGLEKHVYKTQPSPVFEGYTVLKNVGVMTEGYYPAMDNMIQDAIQIFRKQQQSSNSEFASAFETMLTIELIKNKYNE